MPVTFNSVLQIVLFLVVVLLITKPLGLYMTAIFEGKRTWLSPVLVPVERVLYKISGIHAEEEHGWLCYTIDMLVFSVAGMLLLYLIERTQQVLPPGSNMEGKEVRLGITDSVWYDTVSTDTSCGCVNSFVDSYTSIARFYSRLLSGRGDSPTRRLLHSQCGTPWAVRDSTNSALINGNGSQVTIGPGTPVPRMQHRLRARKIPTVCLELTLE